MPGKKNDNSKKKDVNENADLLKEVQYLRMENEYLKKLTALIQEDKQREKDSKNKKSESSKN